MKRLMYAAFIAFLASAATIAIMARLSPEGKKPPEEGYRAVSLHELARHASAADCWLAIDGGVYDVSGYLPAHPAPPRVLSRWCGKEATGAFNTKGRGRPHSSAARAMLPRYRVGALGK